MLAAALDPAVARAGEPTVRECLAASNASAKLRSEHKLREARDKLLVCVSSSCPAEIREECGRRMDRVTASLPSVVFQALDRKGHELSAVRVTMDGAVIADRLDGTAIALDPGSHEFTFEAEGREPLKETLVLHEGDLSRRETVTFGTPAEAAPLAPGPGGAAAPPVAPSASVFGADVAGRGPGELRSGQRTLAFVVGGLGAAGVVAGAVFGGLTIAAWGSVKSECPRLVDCSAAAYDDRSHALTYGTVSTVGLVAGSVLLATGAVLYFTAPKGASQPEIGMAAGPGGLSLSGRF